MSIWLLKAAVQKVISFLPGKHRLNYFFQKHITRGLQLTDELFEDKLTHCREHFIAFQKYNRGSVFTALELGTGWHPVVPIGLFLCGAQKIYTADIVPLLRGKNILLTMQKFPEWNQKGKLKKYLPAMLRERMEALEGLSAAHAGSAQLLGRLNIEPLVGDARALPLPAASVDLLVSNNTMEHIEPALLRGILREFKRIAKPGAVMSHFIDMSDHFAHRDKTITIYNFLKFSDAWWKWIDNSVQPQNRMRLYHYRELYEQENIPIHTEIIRPFNIAEYNRVKVHKKFLSRSAEENAVSHALLVSVM